MVYFRTKKKEPKKPNKEATKRNVYQIPEVEKRKRETEIRSFLAKATHNDSHEWFGP